MKHSVRASEPCWGGLKLSEASVMRIDVTEVTGVSLSVN